MATTVSPTHPYRMDGHRMKDVEKELFFSFISLKITITTKTKDLNASVSNERMNLFRVIANYHVEFLLPINIYPLVSNLNSRKGK